MTGLMIVWFWFRSVTFLRGLTIRVVFCSVCLAVSFLRRDGLFIVCSVVGLRLFVLLLFSVCFGFGSAMLPLSTVSLCTDSSY